MKKAQIIKTMKKVSCPNCGSENIWVQHKRCICRDCNAVFRPFKPYRGKFKRYPDELKKKIAVLYSQGKTVTGIRKTLKIEHVNRVTINRWLRQQGLPARRRPRLKDIQCPSCHIRGESVRDGFVLNRYGIKQEQRFLCRFCGSHFTLTRIIGKKKYPETIRQEAIRYYLTSASVTLKETAHYLNTQFQVNPDQTTIREWLIRHNVKPRGHRGNQHTWKTTQERLGTI